MRSSRFTLVEVPVEHVDLAAREALLTSVFPFFIGLDAGLRIRSIGPSTRRMLPELHVGDAFATAFSLRRPRLPLQMDTLVANPRSLFVVQHASGKQLAGQMLAISRERLLFLASPVIESVEALGASNLRAEHFPAHDRTLDLLLLLRSSQVACAEAVRAQTELREANEQLRSANLAKENLVASVSHELRTPLHTILASMDLLAFEIAPGSSAIQARLMTAQHAGRYLLSLVEDLLDVSALTTKSLRIDIRPVAVRSLLQETIDMLSIQASDKDITLEAALDEVHDETGYVDARRIRQMVTNLLSNALKFSPRGGRVVMAATLDGPDLIVTVTDDGPGISDEAQRRLFTPFSRGETHSSVAGIGLGLYIARELARLHCGDLVLDRTSDAGTRFRLCIPIRAAHGQP